MDIEEAFEVTGRMGRYQVLLTAISYYGNMLFGSQLLLMVIVGATPNHDVPSERDLKTIVTEWDLYEDQWVISLLGSLFLAGFIAGSLLFGQLPDIYGRKPVLVSTVALATVSCFCSAFCQNWHTFAVTRFLGGAFAGGAAAPSFVLMCELVGMIYQLFFSFGIVLVGLLGYLLKDWRLVIMVSSGLSAIVLPFFIFIVPESPRWLYSTGKVDRAQAVIRHIAKKNGKDFSIITLERLDRNKTDETNYQKHSIKDLLKSRTLVKLLCAVTYIWFASSLAYYGLAVDVTTLMPNIYVGAILSGAVEMPANIATPFLLDSKWFGRRGTTVLLLLITSISSSSILFTGDKDELTIAKTVLGLLSKLSIAAGFSVMFIYVSELFPTQIRTVAMVVGNTAARVGGVIAFFVPLLGSIAFFLPYAVFGAVTVIAAGAVLSVPETRGRRPPLMSDFQTARQSLEEAAENNTPQFESNSGDTEALLT